MRIKTTIKPEVKILSVLVKHGEFGQYRMPKETGLSYRTILRFLKPMEKAGWIRLVRTEASEKGGKERKIYALTIRGLAIAFKTADQWMPTKGDLNWVIDKMAEKSGHLLPLVLGKWTYYRSAGLGDEFIRAFRWVTQWILEYGHDTEAFATERFWYFIFQMTARTAKVKWLKALREDPGLRQWAIDKMKRWLLEGRDLMKMHEKSLEALELTSEPDWNKVLRDLRFHAPRESRYSRLS
jgi:hypothetical protein